MIKLNDVGSTMIVPAHVSFMRVHGDTLELVVGHYHTWIDYPSEDAARGDYDRIKEHAEARE